MRKFLGAIGRTKSLWALGSWLYFYKTISTPAIEHRFPPKALEFPEVDRMYYISRNGRQYGPYSADSIRAYLADGSLLATDTICEEGSTVWKPISEVFPSAPPPNPSGAQSSAAPAGAGTPVLDPISPSTATKAAPSPARKSGRKLAPLLAVVLLVALIGAAIYFIFFPPSKQVLFMEGSTTIGDVLAPKLLASFLRAQGATEVLELQGTGADKSHHDIRAKWPGHWQPVVYSIVANGSGNAFKALAASRAQIGMASRPVKNDEVASLADKGDMRSPACESIVALDGLAIIVNNSNSVSRLTRQQVASIFSGKISDWSQVGGQPGAISLYGRDSSSGTFDTFVALIFAGDKKAFSSKLHPEDNGEAIANAVSRDPAAIGYVGIAQIGSQKALELSDGPGTASLLPSPFTVATEDYILSRRLFFYTAENRDDFTRKFIDFALGPQGQTLVEEVGFVKQIPILERVPIPPTAPAAYRSRVSGLRRMSLNFRFRPNSTNLDNKALADLPRAMAALKQSNISTDVIVLGFADNKGTAVQNQNLSEQRAAVVGDRLKAYGIQVQTVGFSSAMPVGDNATPDGREKNRRVEVWAP